MNASREPLLADTLKLRSLGGGLWEFQVTQSDTLLHEETLQSTGSDFRDDGLNAAAVALEDLGLSYNGADAWRQDKDGSWSAPALLPT